MQRGLLWLYKQLTVDLLYNEQVSMAGRSNYIPQYLWDLITCPCPWYLVIIYIIASASEMIMTGMGTIHRYKTKHDKTCVHILGATVYTTDIYAL